MSKIAIWSATLCVLGSSDLQAQSLALGVEAGVSSTHLATPDDYWGSRLGFLLGASASVSLAPWLAVQAGLRLHEKGAAVPDEFEMRIRYLEVPLLVRLSVGSTAWHFRPVITFGLAPATELSCSARARPMYIPEAPPPPMRPMDCISDRTDRWDLGVVAGAGVEVRLGTLRATVAGQYTSGTHNIASGYPGGFPIHNRATSVVLSTSVPLWPRRPSN
jgi:hypothetical protein